MLYLVKTKDFEKELETRNKLIFFVEELKARREDYKIFERVYNASRSKIISETEVRLELSSYEKHMFGTQALNKAKLSDVFEYFKNEEPKIEKWFIDNHPTIPTVIDLKELYKRAHYESRVEMMRGTDFKGIAERFGFFIAPLQSERHRQLVLIVPTEYKEKTDHTIRVTVPHGYNIGLIIGANGTNIRYSLDRLNQEYGTEFKAIILS